MARKNITSHDIARTIHRVERTVREKIKGTSRFTHPETVKIRDEYFNDQSLEYLFAGEPAKNAGEPEGER
jgi:hypothetical protein